MPDRARARRQALSDVRDPLADEMETAKLERDTLIAQQGMGDYQGATGGDLVRDDRHREPACRAARGRTAPRVDTDDLPATGSSCLTDGRPSSHRETPHRSTRSHISASQSRSRWGRQAGRRRTTRMDLVDDRNDLVADIFRCTFPATGPPTGLKSHGLCRSHRPHCAPPRPPGGKIEDVVGVFDPLPSSARLRF